MLPRAEIKLVFGSARKRKTQETPADESVDIKTDME
jgi:hypothetical protein